MLLCLLLISLVSTVLLLVVGHLTGRLALRLAPLAQPRHEAAPVPARGTSDGPPAPVRRAAGLELVNAIAVAALWVGGAALVAQVFAEGPQHALGGLLYADALSALVVGVILVVGGAAALYSIGYLRRDVASGEVPSDRLGWYYAGLHGFIGTMLVTCTVDNLGLLWVGIEATTVVSALLVGFYGTPTALEAAWKYLVVCTIGIIFALFGILLLYAAAVHAQGEGASLDWTALMAAAGRFDPALVKVAFVFLQIGFGTKAGLAPMHTWLPDAHSQAPSPVSAVLSGVLLNCALYAIMRGYGVAVGTLGTAFPSQLLLGFGLLSVAIAIPFIVIQRDVKRLLAYSSVEHVGLIAVALGLGGPLGFYAGLLHLVNHALTKALLFFTAGELVQRYGTRRIAAIRGVVEAAPWIGTLLLLGTFAITGAPPFAVFLSEFGILSAGAWQGAWPVVAAVAAMLVAVFAGFVAHAAGMALGRPSLRPEVAPLPVSGAFALALPAVGMVVLGLYVPPPLAEVLQSVARLIAGGAP